MFPATYTLVEGGPVRDLVAKQLGAFKRELRHRGPASPGART